MMSLAVFHHGELQQEAFAKRGRWGRGGGFAPAFAPSPSLIKATTFQWKAHASMCVRFAILLYFGCKAKQNLLADHNTIPQTRQVDFCQETNKKDAHAHFQ